MKQILSYSNLKINTLNLIGNQEKYATSFNLSHLGNIYPSTLTFVKNNDKNLINLNDISNLIESDILGYLYDDKSNKVVTLKIEKTFVTSPYADRHLNFQHNLVDKDKEKCPISNLIKVTSQANYFKITIYK